MDMNKGVIKHQYETLLRKYKDYKLLISNIKVFYCIHQKFFKELDYKINYMSKKKNYHTNITFENTKLINILYEVKNKIFSLNNILKTKIKENLRFFEIKDIELENLEKFTKFNKNFKFNKNLIDKWVDLLQSKNTKFYESYKLESYNEFQKITMLIEEFEKEISQKYSSISEFFQTYLISIFNNKLLILKKSKTIKKPSKSNSSDYSKYQTDNLMKSINLKIRPDQSILNKELVSGKSNSSNIFKLTKSKKSSSINRSRNSNINNPLKNSFTPSNHKN